MLSHIHRPKQPYRMGRLPEPTIQPCTICGLASTSGDVCILCKPSCLKSPEREHQLAKAKTMDEWIDAYLLPDVPDEVTPEPDISKADFGDMHWSQAAKMGAVTKHRNNGTLPKRARVEVDPSKELPL